MRKNLKAQSDLCLPSVKITVAFTFLISSELTTKARPGKRLNVECLE